MATSRYRVSVHLIEARDIKLRNGSVPNPYAEVEVCGVVRRTYVTAENSQCLWDSHLTWEDLELTAEQCVGAAGVGAPAAARAAAACAACIGARSRAHPRLRHPLFFAGTRARR
jgi:hypothetical protein